MNIVHHLVLEIYQKEAQKINPLNAELNPICHLLALVGAHHIVRVTRIRVKLRTVINTVQTYSVGSDRQCCSEWVGRVFEF